jgi:hypothetical protein
VLAALERAAEHTRLAGAGIAGTVRLSYAPMASFETRGTILAAVEGDSPNMTIIPSELFSAEIPGRVLAGEADIGLALHPESMSGVGSEPIRRSRARHCSANTTGLAGEHIIPLASLRRETLLLFPRELAPTYYDHIIEACERAGFQPRVNAQHGRAHRGGCDSRELRGGGTGNIQECSSSFRRLPRSKTAS